MKLPVASIALAILASLAPAQLTRVSDVGLTLDLGPVLPAFVGYDCGSFSCAPLDAGTWVRGATRTFTGYGAPNAPWALLVGLPGFCIPVGGIGNALIPGPPYFILHTGVTGPASPTSPCQQGAERVPFTMPNTAPIGLVLCIQNAAFSGTTGGLAFGPALDVRITG